MHVHTHRHTCGEIRVCSKRENPWSTVTSAPRLRTRRFCARSCLSGLYVAAHALGHCGARRRWFRWCPRGQEIHDSLFSVSIVVHLHGVTSEGIAARGEAPLGGSFICVLHLRSRPRVEAEGHGSRASDAALKREVVAKTKELEKAIREFQQNQQEVLFARIEGITRSMNSLSARARALARHGAGIGCRPPRQLSDGFETSR